MDDNNQGTALTDLKLQVLNLKHNLDTIGKALDEKDLIIYKLCARCAYTTERRVCEHCEVQHTCNILMARYSDEFWYDKIIEYI